MLLNKATATTSNCEDTSQEAHKPQHPFVLLTFNEKHFLQIQLPCSLFTFLILYCTQIIACVLARKLKC